MRRFLSTVTAWILALGAFAAAAFGISRSEPAYIARASAELNRLDVSASGIGGFARVDFAQGSRTMPQEVATRLRSTGTLRRALRHLGLPDDDRALEAAGEAITARLMPATVIIEVRARAADPRRAEDLVNALLKVHEDMRREERVRLADQVLASMEVTLRGLLAEGREIAAKMAGFDVRRPIEASMHSNKLDSVLVDLVMQRASVAGSIGRLEALKGGSLEALLQNLEDLRQKSLREEDAGTAGYAALRAAVTEKQAELASLKATQGANSRKVAEIEAELRATEASLREYARGALIQLRSQLAALDRSEAEIRERLGQREEGLKTLRLTETSPEYDALVLRAAVVRAQVGQLELRRSALLTYRQMDEPMLNIISPAKAGEAPETEYREARWVFAAFGAVLTGLSLTTLFRHPEFWKFS